MITKCMYCSRTFTNMMDIGTHLENKHSELMPEDINGAQWYIIQTSGRRHGTCVICKQATLWNPKTNKYKRFCENPNCKEKYALQFKNRMINKYGKPTLLTDPNHQKKMLANRKISGIYRFQNGKQFTYTGSYELDFLEFLDMSLDWDTSDLFTPSPHTYMYKYNTLEHFYIPDVYIPSLNLEIEIKDGGDNPNTHHKIIDIDKVKEKLKERTLKSIPNVNYLKIPNKQNHRFLDYLDVVRTNIFNNNLSRIWME